MKRGGQRESLKSCSEETERKKAADEWRVKRERNERGTLTEAVWISAFRLYSALRVNPQTTLFILGLCSRSGGDIQFPDIKEVKLLEQSV